MHALTRKSLHAQACMRIWPCADRERACANTRVCAARSPGERQPVMHACVCTRTHQQTNDQPGQQIANSRELQSASSSAAVTALYSSEPRSIEIQLPTLPFGFKDAHWQLAAPNDCARTSLPPRGRGTPLYTATLCRHACRTRRTRRTMNRSPINRRFSVAPMMDWTD